MHFLNSFTDNDFVSSDGFSNTYTPSGAHSTFGAPTFHASSRPAQPDLSIFRHSTSTGFECYTYCTDYSGLQLSVGSLPHAGCTSLQLEDLIDVSMFDRNDCLTAQQSTPLAQDQVFAQVQSNSDVGPLVLIPFPGGKAFGGQQRSMSVPNAPDAQAPSQHYDCATVRPSSAKELAYNAYNHPEQELSAAFQMTSSSIELTLPLYQVSNNVAHRPGSLEPPFVAPSPLPFQPAPIRTPPSPSTTSSTSTSLLVSPATSRSSFSVPPSESASSPRVQTHRWRLNSPKPAGWTCDCKSKAKKKKRHMESCPRNPDKPVITCPCCPQPFIGGSRKSALRKHMGKFHPGMMYLLKALKNKK